VVAPQVVAFLALTHAVPGLRRVRPEDDPGPAASDQPPWERRQVRVPWLTRPMRFGIALAWISLVVGVLELGSI
jgi:hypothetical protein